MGRSLCCSPCCVPLRAQAIVNWLPGAVQAFRVFAALREVVRGAGLGQTAKFSSDQPRGSLCAVSARRGESYQRLCGQLAGTLAAGARRLYDGGASMQLVLGVRLLKGCVQRPGQRSCAAPALRIWNRNAQPRLHGDSCAVLRRGLGVVPIG